MLHRQNLRMQDIRPQPYVALESREDCQEYIMIWKATITWVYILPKHPFATVEMSGMLHREQGQRCHRGRRVFDEGNWGGPPELST